ncbi:MAG: magnesium transporter CorA family protein, partial [Thermicanus sp.]|nr:magnesium transporter CorA family protein [Thermicanus sp.]
MIRIFFTNNDGQLEERTEICNGCWVHLVSPTESEILRVAEHLQIPLNFLKDPLDEEERSRIEKEDQLVLIIVNVPVYLTDDQESPIFDTLPLGMIITPEAFITVSLKDHPIFHEFMENRIKQFFTFKKTRFSLQILYQIATHYLRYLKLIYKRTNEIERELHQSMKNQELYTLLNLEKSLVYFTTSLKSNNIVMQKMMRNGILKMYEDDQDLLEDVIIENQQAIEMAETHSAVLSGMMDAFASVISNNLNIVMKFLASFTILLSLPTMVASFYGMNVPIPFQTHPFSFWVAILISAFLSTATAVI